MFCPNCGTDNAGTPKFCGKCGFRFLEANNVMNGQPVMQAAPMNQEPVLQPMPELQPMPGMQPVPQYQEQPQWSAVPQEKPAKVKKAKGGKGGLLKILIPVAVVVVGVGVAIAVNASSVGNAIKKSFSSPEAYSQYVETRAMEERLSNLTDDYDSVIKDMLNFADTSMKVKVEVNLTEDGQDMLSLAGLSGLDLSWFTGVSATAEINSKDNMFGTTASVDVNGVEMIKALLLADELEGNLFAQSATVNEKYLGYEMDDLEEIAEFLESYQFVYDALPDGKTLNKLILKYYELAYSVFDDVEKSTEKVTIEGITEECTVLTTEVDEETGKDMLLLVLETMKEDKEVKNLIIDMVNALNETDWDVDADAEDVYDEFLEALEDACDEIEDADYGDELAFTIETYVNKKGEIVGRVIEQPQMTTSSIMVHKGKNFGYEYSQKINEDYYREIYGDYYDYYYADRYENQNFKLVGSGTDKNDKLTGEFFLKVNGTKVLELTTEEFDTENATGTVTMKVPSSIKKALGIDTEYMDSEEAMVFSLITKTELRLVSSKDGDFRTLRIFVNYDGDEWGDIAVTAGVTKAESVKAPKDSNVVWVEEGEEEEALEDWIETLSFQTLIDSLKEINAPSELIDELEELEDMDKEDLLYNLF